MDFDNLPVEGVEIPEDEIFSENQKFEDQDIAPQKDDLILLMKLKNKIMRYKVLFPHIFGENFSYKFENLDEMSAAELERLIMELSIMVNSNNSMALTQTIYFEGVRIIEVLSPYANIHLKGLHESLKNNQNVIDCLNEISLKYEDATHTEPEIRILYATLTTALQLHKLNSSNVEIVNFLKKEIPKDKLEKYSQL